jgi:hypothetical protein
MRTTSVSARLTLLVLLVLTVPAAAVDWTSFEGTARGFPVLRDTAGKKISDGDFVQWLENGRLHVKIVYSGQTRRIEENAVFRQRPELAQEQWSLRENRGGKLYRQFTVNFTSGTAAAKKLEDGELKEWSENVKVEGGRAFAGFGFTLATKALRRRLMRGETVELQAVGFSPKPRVVTVEISYDGLDRVPMGGRTIRGERYVVHPKLPLIADLFVNVPDAHIWLTTPAPAAFLRWEGPLAEPSDPITRVDLLPGGSSGPATPVGTAGRRD